MSHSALTLHALKLCLSLNLENRTHSAPSVSIEFDHISSTTTKHLDIPTCFVREKYNPSIFKICKM